ncbi:hypothetical protein PFICI_03236 [Pestalotiopsis fici W106-1]|uniref:NADH:flavin oxidoreductase/NADH oxidase N-terminal domain-containing protein n=1 Tax=Pestalotiopsis fici (strain W106-1 / CGMCC3.15140) TaxID=1229662 RepID=W3XJ19_PESFW|nr:uncharacterized protein PFICI_03236 [Pestalotiopsis fici W106-1]ETS85211.1 hypothetical protein PFICI_03236 [Pestalotiopsis fici W106-1]
MDNSRLFKPIFVGDMKLTHRIGLCPLTRNRSSDEHVPLDLVTEYYRQRSSVPGTLLISEGTFISAEDGGMNNVPGIYNQAQIEAWKKVTDAVHANGSYIFCQLWALGRAATIEVAEREGFPIASSSAIPIDLDSPVPQELTADDIKRKVQNYASAAKKAIEAGFDGVELHAANGYLIDQFIQDTCNQRGDQYGGSVENCTRFAVEVAQAVVDAVGCRKVGIRFSPWSHFQGMRMDDPIPQFSAVIRNMAKLNLVYLHLVESRIAGGSDVEAADQLNFAYDLWNSTILVAGGFKPDTAQSLVDKEYPEKDIVVMFGRYFLATPDLPFRVRNGIELNEYNRATFYTPKAPTGYIDYPFSDEFLAAS